MHQAYHLETMYKDVNISTGLLEEVMRIAIPIACMQHKRSPPATHTHAAHTHTHTRFEQLKEDDKLAKAAQVHTRPQPRCSMLCRACCG